MGTPRKFAISEELCGDTITLAVAGELDLSTVPELARRVEDKLATNRPTKLTLDLADLTFMDSSGLRLLIELDRRSAQEAWRLALLPSKHESASLVLRLTGADDALPFEDHSPD
jgi:anti-sigma B factor antagonist